MKYSSIYVVIIIVCIGIYLYYNSIENFQNNTLDTFANLPSWLIYMIIVILLLAIFLHNILPWIIGAKAIAAGASTANTWIKAAHQRPPNTLTRRPNNNY
jgi:hypothetical protein